MEQTVNKQQEQRPPYGLLAVLMVAAFIAFLNNTLLNIALPSIMNDLKVEASTVQWLTTGYMLVNGILIPTTAFLIQKYSVRKLFIAALGLFLTGTILAGVAHEFSILLIGRMTQASGSAILMPLLMNVMLVSFPVEKRGAAMGVFGLILMGAPAIGPTLSGWLVEHYNWRMLFHFVTPIAVIVFLLGIFLIKDKKQTVNITLDYFSVVLSSVGFGGLLYGFSSAGNKGWDSPYVYGTIAAGVIGLAWFILRQIRQEKPMLNFKIFKYPMYALSVSISMVVTMAMFSGMLLLPIYTQNLRGITPFDAGLMLLPGAIMMAVMSPINGRLFDKYGGRVLAIIGLTITVITSYFFSQLTLETTYTNLVILYTVRMFGMSMVMMPVSTNGLNQLPAKYYPHGTAMNNTLQQVSGAIGTALLVTAMSNRAETRGQELAEEATKNSSSMTTQPTAEQIAQMKQQIMMQSTLDGINFAFYISVFIAALALFLAFFIKRAKQADDIIESKEAMKAMPKLADNN
ncbi:DHA2 family efflux MFS transporter permease subunit [Metabacillus litoralis]|uniref:DHA2 family efflux MFS transporter permease subunit n=1 Tax=Metabacillus litoralis TaxID=152268 RepID=UPI001BA1A836|nr:DHA2 family efflux MFS transporter permease subunit [Metabacillus litoralis]UHA58516.1 DHA2 family efflux MFS transporter permease subunit [Metabacillus litoralis]